MRGYGKRKGSVRERRGAAISRARVKALSFESGIE
jgi:hypothetical protein